MTRDLLVTRDLAGTEPARRLRSAGLPLAERAFLLFRLDDQSRPRMSRSELETSDSDILSGFRRPGCVLFAAAGSHSSDAVVADTAVELEVDRRFHAAA